MITIKKGDKAVIYAGSMILKDYETVRLEISLPTGAPLAAQMLKLEITFTDIMKTETDVEWVTRPDGTVQFRLTGWRQTGQALKEPIFFGQYNNEKLWLHVAQHRLGAEVNIVQIDVLQGGSANAG
jgi:hypothetical protein